MATQFKLFIRNFAKAANVQEHLFRAPLPTTASNTVHWETVNNKCSHQQEERGEVVADMENSHIRAASQAIKQRAN